MMMRMIKKIVLQPEPPPEDLVPPPLTYTGPEP
jgi:hypothetical protein